MNFKGRVIELWEEAGKPNWDYIQALNVCVDVNTDFITKSQNHPTKKFRDAIDRNDETYIKTWVMGCHFQWLNPR